MLNQKLFLNKNVFNADVEQKPIRNGFGEGYRNLFALRASHVAVFWKSTHCLYT